MCRKVTCLVALVIALNLALACTVEAATATAAWLFDEGSGTVVDDATRARQYRHARR